MNVVADTSVCSLALRRARRVDDAIRRELGELIQEGRVIIVGPVRQELLSGIESKPQFEQLPEHLPAFPDLELESVDYEDAVAAYNRCRERGIQGSNTDFLICAVAMRRDFKLFARALRFALHQVRS